LAAQRRSHGDELGALAHLIAAQTLEAYAAGSPSASATDLCKVATGYFTAGDYAAAARWYRLVLLLDAKLAVAHQNLAAIHALAGQVAEADSSRERAYQIQRVFIDPAGNPARQVLILCVGRTSGNVPFEPLFSNRTCRRIMYAIDYAADQEDAQLPPYDLVFNAVGDPDIAAPLAERLLRFARRCGRPVLNPPAAVARTQRHRMCELLGDLDDVVVPACIRFDGPAIADPALSERLANAGIEWPLLARPASTHGGDGLVLCESLEALQDALGSSPCGHYLTRFRDYRSADGCYRKYRIIFVDREPLPYHLAISSHWMVHYFSADMTANAWKIAEERAFLEEPETALGSRAMRAVNAIGRRLDLDYGGVDFTLLPDGRVLLFEANATMLVHRERQSGPLAHKSPHVQRIVDAFEHLQARRSSP
jgi:tetratricopeptide (TPR) repeat protein